MSATVLAPVRARPTVVRAGYRPGTGPLRICGPAAERVRIGLAAGGFALTGEVEVALDPTPDVVPVGIDLPVALAVLLSMPAHREVRQPNLMAWGALASDGILRPWGPPPAQLPPGPWVARFWRPTDRLPEPGADAVLSIIDVDDVTCAWGVVVGLLDLGRRLGCLGRPAEKPGPARVNATTRRPPR